MKPKLILCLALVLSGGLFGCSTATRHSAAVAKAQLKFVKVDSEETNGQDGYGKNAVDGNPNTYWHTQWQTNTPPLPHEIIIELIPPSIIKGFTCLPRQDESDHGTIKDYEFYVSNDGKNFGEPVKKGTFEPGKEEKIETFEPIKCRFIKLKAISEINGQPWTSAAEIGVIQNDENVSAMTNPINQATSRLAEFEKDKSIDQLEAAYVAVGNIPEPGADKTVPKTVARREKTMILFKLLAVIDQNIDINFNSPNNTNYSAIVNMYYPGVELKLTKDPVFRATFEAAVKRNDENIARLNFQTRLHNIDQSANIFAERFLQDNYTASKEDQSELEKLMQQAELSQARTQKLKSLFETAAEKSWQTTLSAAVTNSFFPPISTVGIMIYTVPSVAAKILGSQSPSELMPFLIKLRASQSSWEAGTVDEWSIIVLDGLHGTPGVITSTFTTAKEITVTNKIPVYTYADHFLGHTESKP